MNSRFLRSERTNRAYESPTVEQYKGMILEDRLLKARFARHAETKLEV